MNLFLIEPLKSVIPRLAVKQVWVSLIEESVGQIETRAKIL